MWINASALLKARNKLEFQLILSNILLAGGHFLLVFVNDLVTG